MGKGNRNRQKHYEEALYAPKKKVVKKKTKVAPKWLAPVIAGAIALCIVAAIVAGCIVNSGVIEKDRVVIKSETGLFDITQPMAAYYVFADGFYQGYYAYMYDSYYSLYSGQLTETYNSWTECALSYAKYATEDLRNSIDDVAETLGKMVASCDAAYKDANYETLLKLDDEEKEDVGSTYQWLIDLCDDWNDYANDYNESSSGTYYGTYSDYKKFIKDYVGKGVTEENMALMDTISILSSKWNTYKSFLLNETIGKDQSVIDKYIVDNANDYYKVSYLSYEKSNATDDTLGAGLSASMTETEFKQYIFNVEYFSPAYTSLFSAESEEFRTQTFDYMWNLWNDGDYDFVTGWDDAGVETGSYTTEDEDQTTAIATALKDTVEDLSKTASEWDMIRVTTTETEEGSETVTRTDKILNITSLIYDDAETKANVIGINYKVKTLVNNEYLDLYDAIIEAMGEDNEDDMGITTTTATSVDVSSTDTFTAWLAENTKDESANTITFARATGDTTYVYDSDNATDTLYVVTAKPSTSLTETIVGYGGYLLYDTEEQATTAYNSVKDLTGYAQYLALSKLTTTNVTSDGEEEEEEENSFTMDTDIGSSVDDNVYAFMSGTEYGVKVVQADDNSGYYLCYLVSNDKTYVRTIRDTLISEEIETYLDATNKYAPIEANLDKIGKKTEDEE